MAFHSFWESRAALSTYALALVILFRGDGPVIFFRQRRRECHCWETEFRGIRSGWRPLGSHCEIISCGGGTSRLDFAQTPLAATGVTCVVA